MKKSIALILAVAMIIAAFAFVGCGDENSDNDAGSQEEQNLSVTIVVPSGFGDKSFNDSAHDGGEQIKSDLGLNVSYIECQGEAFKQRMMDAAENSDIVVLVGWEFYEITDVAGEYPEVKFIWVDNQVETPESYPNLLNVVYAQNEGSYLAGYIAAAMSESGTIGAVGGDDISVINDFIVGYKQGAEAYNPDIEVKQNYAGGDYENPAMGKELALSINGLGADVIFQVAGNTGSGVFEAAKENNFLAIGVDKDQKSELPNYDDVILCSMKKEVGLSIYDLVKMYADDGVLEGGKVWLADMANGYVGISYGGENSIQLVPDDIKTKVEELKQDIISGKIEVETTRSY